MNYKIRITAENQAIVKRIADENGMNPHDFSFNSPNPIYHIENGEFTFYPQVPKETNDYTELTTEQFIELFDKKETELDKWLRETKAKNLSLDELKIYITNKSSCNDDLYKKLRIKLDIKGGISLADFLFNQWNNPTEESPKVETEWQPKRGDRVLVWNNNEEMATEAIYFDTDKFIICFWNEKEFENYSNSNCFRLGNYCHMKPLPIEQPKETDFKSKVIELIESEHQKSLQLMDDAIYSKNYLDAHAYIFKSSIYKDLLNQIKQL
jgi:hypothetical protein